MSADDDQIRRALSAGTASVTARSALREIRPSMRHARTRRRVAASATVAALLIGGGAGVFALTARDDPATLRSVTSDQVGQPLPTVTEVVVPSTSISSTVDALEERQAVTEPTTTTAPTSALPDDDGGVPTEQVEPSSTVELPAPAPVEPLAPASPVPASFQTITSVCGEVVVSIDAGAVRISTITARPGFDPLVAQDGPNSIEMTFTGESDQKCELHAELKPGGLDVEVQNPETDQ
jgi:hypothetical protein